MRALPRTRRFADRLAALGPMPADFWPGFALLAAALPVAIVAIAVLP